MTKRRRSSFSSSQIILNKTKPGSFILFLFIFCCSSDPSRFPALLSTCVLNIGALRLSSLLVNISYSWVLKVKLLYAFVCFFVISFLTVWTVVNT